MVGDKRERDTNRCRAREKERLTEKQRRRERGGNDRIGRCRRRGKSGMQERASPFDVSRFPDVLPRDGGGFRAWNPPRDIRTKWISCTLRRITR